MNKQASTQGHLAAFVTIFIWGTTFISTKVLLVDFSPVEILFFRLVLAYCVLLLVRPHFIKYKNIREELLFAGAGLCGVTLYFIFQNFALSYTLASNVSVLVSVSPFFTAILSHFFLKDEELRANFFIGFAVSILGIILIAFNGNYVLKLNPLGDVLAVLSAVVWSVYSILMKKITAFKYTIQVTRRIFFYGFIFLLPTLGLFNFRLDPARFAAMPNLLNMLFLGIGASALCYVTWTFALSVLGAVKTSVYIYVIPVITILVSVIVIHETITLVAITGVALILSGLYLSERKTK
jgi:drug/metabolite transporter (DMT)-like permease